MAPEHLHPLKLDRSMSEEWIREFLHRAGACVFVTVRNGRPLPIPLNYVYDPAREAIYVHKGKRGSTLDALGEGGPVTLTAFEMGRILPASQASEFGVEYASVVVFGQGSVVEDPVESEAALVLIMEKYAPHLKAGEDYLPVSPDEVRMTAVLRVDIESWSGKEKKEAPDFPGAYHLEDVR
jgi:nitroimidazol reductase NimA-like FMN-containing flavoprotein (pyridoxamine 5'-phosphate oxidase superfamily)